MIKTFKPVNKAYKFRIYPNQEQQELINKTVGCSRFIYNEFLAKAKDDNYKSYSELLGIEIPSFMVACFYGSYP
ncbi:helix-turn-helix domain-containing protein [Acetohalobium arabaticum]|uniref:helix-turn-helix domain-containing protein n=1 Tax=Acetohalobium arabaticum TaxID=28187 RepID=UPI00059FFB4C|nr:helix-turn-helix domain-containing protein [Acetohalobium arabaticum]